MKQAAENQQKGFEAVKSLVDSARGQHLAQLEELQQRHGQERAEWEQRLRDKVEATRKEMELDTARRLEAAQRSFDEARLDYEARLREAEASSAAAEARADELNNKQQAMKG